MIEHIVLFELKPFDSPELKAQHLALVKQELEALPAKIDALESLRVALNENPAENYDFALIAEVKDLAALELYAQDPEHLRIARELVRPHLVSRACVDYRK